MALTEAEAARLAQLKAKRDALMTGDSVRRITHGDRSKELAPGDLAALQGEIDRLEAAAVTGTRKRRGAITFVFRG